MHRSHIIGEGFGQDYALVTYDLTTAKIAKTKRIQPEETSIFDNLFIYFGSFQY